MEHLTLQGSLFSHKEAADCSLSEYLLGKDRQGIPWDAQPRTRNELRASLKTLESAGMYGISKPI